MSQDVCPYNVKFAHELKETAFAPREMLARKDTRRLARDLLEMTQEDFAASFKSSTRLAARLQHPHIVPLLTAGDVDGLPYYSMPFVAGASLRERMLAGSLPWLEAQGILRDVAKTIPCAHRQGIVHRDIKPENALPSEGTAMVPDFRVSHAISAGLVDPE